MNKSLFEFISEEIDKALPPNSGVTGQEVYLRGWERYENAYFEQQMSQKRRALERQKQLPLDEEMVDF